jgi:hypothetical protein
LKSQLREREIQLNTLSHSGEADLHSSVNSNIIHGSQSSSNASLATTSAKWEAEQKVNHLIDLDLEVPSSPSKFQTYLPSIPNCFLIYLISAVFHTGNYSASSDEESDEDEVILNM